MATLACRRPSAAILEKPQRSHAARQSLGKRPLEYTTRARSNALFFTAMQFEYDPERLIAEVKNRPGIWDSDDVNYRAKDMKHKMWNDIVNELLQGDVKVSKSEMRELELQLQKKWKSLRDCFQKYVQNPNKQRRPYIYSKHLQFLLKNKTVSDKEVTSASDDEKEREKNRKIWRTKKTLKLVKAEEASTESEEDNYQEEFISYSNDNTEHEIPAKIPKTSKAEEFLFASVDRQDKVDGEDADKMFLLSLLPHLKSIPEAYRLNAKMDLMQVLRNANYSAVTDKLV